MTLPRLGDGLAIWHPDGAPRRRLDWWPVDGQAPPPPNEAVDLLVVWLQDVPGPRALDAALSQVPVRLEEDGMAWLLLGRAHRRSVPSRSARHGLTVVDEVIGVGGWRPPHHLVPVDPVALPYAARGPLRSPRWLASAAAMASRTRVGRRLIWLLSPHAALVVSRQPGAARFAWLTATDPAVRSITVGTGRVDAAVATIACLGSTGRAVHWGKVALSPAGDARLDHERRALKAVAPAAALAGARVPEVIPASAPAPLWISVVPGAPVDGELPGRPDHLSSVIDQLVVWLARWGAATARRTEATDELLEQHLLAPARRVLAGRSQLVEYHGRLMDLAERCRGQRITLVASHNDLTMANLLVAHGQIGVVDWEAGLEAGLPTADLWYAVVDGCARVRGVSAAAALSSVVRHDDGLTIDLDAATARLIGELDLTPLEAELAFHGCWVAHAADEHDRGREGGPFDAVVAMVAGGEVQRSLDARWKPAR